MISGCEIRTELLISCTHSAPSTFIDWVALAWSICKDHNSTCIPYAIALAHPHHPAAARCASSAPQNFLRLQDFFCNSVFDTATQCCYTRMVSALEKQRNMHVVSQVCL